jgi:toxin secretion/phage lysis holin
MDTERIQTAVAAGCGILVGVWVGIDVALQALVALMALDFLSGVVAGARTSGLDSTTGYLGWKRKANTLLALAATAVLQPMVNVNGVVPPATQVVATGFAVIEVFSVIENAQRAGVKFPAFLLDLFARMRAAAGVEEK